MMSVRQVRRASFLLSTILPMERFGEEIRRRQQEIATRKDNSASGLKWDVVESVPVSEDIKKQDGQWRDHIQNYNQTLTNLAAQGIEIVCYNFMPILDWTRTNLRWELANGGTCMRFDLTDFVRYSFAEASGRNRRLP